MIANTPANGLFGLISTQTLIYLFDLGFGIFALLYFMFSLIVIRQVFSMTQTVATEAGFALRFLAFLHSGLALLVVVLFIAFI